MGGNASGHRSVPHTADLRIEAWAPTRDGCIRQAVLGTVESFLDTSSAQAQQTRRRRLTGNRDDDLLVAALEEVIYLLDTTGEAPVDVNLSQADGCRYDLRDGECNRSSPGGRGAKGGVTQRASPVTRQARLAMLGNS